MSQKKQAAKIIHSHILWATGSGLIPIPLVDFAAVTAIQLEMLQQLADLHNVSYSNSKGKAFVYALSGTTLASLGASLFKAIPGVGSFIGGASMALTSGASTYAVGQVAVKHFANGGTLDNFVEEQLRTAYEEAFEHGKTYVADIENKHHDDAAKAYEALAQLGKLRDQGILTEEEFQTKKQELLSRL